jgi:Helix-turn-helix domain
MEPQVRQGQSAGVRNAAPRNRRPLPPQEMRDWMTPSETAHVLGCSVATVHRLRRGLIGGIEPLPFIQYGRKIVFRKLSIAQWRERNERGRLAA